jgi:hypothetical protein
MHIQLEIPFKTRIRARSRGYTAAGVTPFPPPSGPGNITTDGRDDPHN